MSKRYITPDELRTLKNHDELNADDVAVLCGGHVIGRALHKAESGEGEPSERSLLFKISDGSVDYYNDTISVDGWKWDAFMKSGSMLWAHNGSEPPIAKPLSVFKSDGALYSRAEFPEAGVSEFATMIHKLFVSGVLRGVSVGFKPLKWVFNEERRGFDFTEQALLEYSGTPMPANANAVMQAKSAGTLPDLKHMLAWFDQVLDVTDGGNPSRAVLERTRSLFAAPALSIDIGTIARSMSVTEERAGKVLSRQNEERLSGALEAAQRSAALVGEVLASSKKTDEDEDEDKSLEDLIDVDSFDDGIEVIDHIASEDSIEVDWTQ